jgi:hypothetical protein
VCYHSPHKRRDSLTIFFTLSFFFFADLILSTVQFIEGRPLNSDGIELSFEMREALMG